MLGYIDAQLMVASPRDAAPLIRRRLDVAAELRQAQDAARQAGEAARTDQDELAFFLRSITDEDDGLPEWAVDQIEAACAKRMGRKPPTGRK